MMEPYRPMPPPDVVVHAPPDRVLSPREVLAWEITKASTIADVLGLLVKRIDAGRLSADYQVHVNGCSMTPSVALQTFGHEAWMQTTWEFVP